MTTPAIVVVHQTSGLRALGRIALIARESSWPVYTVEARHFDLTAALEVVRLVGAGSLLKVIHLVDVDSESTVDLTVAERITEIATSILVAYPAVALRSWAIVTTGYAVDDIENATIREIRPLLAGAIVTTSSTRTSVAHTPADEVCFAADLAIALGISPLDEKLADFEGVWMGAACSVAYAPDLARRVDAETRINATIEHVRSSGSADTYLSIGENWAKDRELDSDASRARLFGSPGGGTLQVRVRMDSIDFDGVPVESWSEVIFTQYDMLRVHEMPLIEDQLTLNRHEMLVHLETEVVDAVMNEMANGASVSSSVAFVEGVRAETARAIDRLGSVRSVTAASTIARDRTRLRKLIRWLPHGPAAGLRLVLVSLLTLIVGSMTTAQDFGPPIDVFASGVPALLAVGVLVVGSMVFFARWRTTIRVRDRLARAIEGQLEAEVVEMVWGAHLGVLQDLLAFIGTSTDEPAKPGEASTLIAWLRGVDHVIESLHEASSESSDDLSSIVESPYARLLTATRRAAVETGESAADTKDRIVAALAAVLRPSAAERPLAVPDAETLREEWVSSLSGAVLLAWRTLAELLSNDVGCADVAQRVMASDLTPSFGADLDSTRFLIAPAGEAEALEAFVSPSVGATALGSFLMPIASLSSAAQNYLVLAHLAPRSFDEEVSQ